MTQKVLKVGSSAAVTIPKKSLEELGWKIGDKVSVQVDIKKRQINNVIIKANVNPEKLASYYRSCQLFLSMSEHEGFGIPVLEAIYYGVPVLSYRIPAMEEVLPPANLFDSIDVQKVADKIAVIQIDKRKKNKLIRDQSKILNKFQDNILIADFVKLIKSSFNL